MKWIAISAFLLSISLTSGGQISARLIKYVDVSDTHITFVYGGDIWITPKEGGQAFQVTHSPGEESFPRFSPDGTEIAYTASYNGNLDVYVVPATGGVARRITFASYPDRMIDWHPDGKRILFASRRETGIPSVSQFFIIDKNGGMPQRLEVPYGELASFSGDGNRLAYVTKITENYPFKRYRGGLTSDVMIFDLNTRKAENITNNMATDGKPAWAGDKIYYISDQDEMMRRNIWAYDTKTATTRQITSFTESDITYLSAGPNDLVFETGGLLYRMDLDTEKYQEVLVEVVSDLSIEIPRVKNVSRSIQNMTASPGGKRITFEARGELFNVPVKEGYILNITATSGAFDRNPSWSPDGKSIAYWSDLSGEYEIYLQSAGKSDPPRRLTDRRSGFGYNLFWSPDSRKIAFIDEKNDISIIDVTTGVVKIADNYSWNIGHGGRFSYTINWSPDSKWITYSKGQDNVNGAIFIYNEAESKAYRVTSGYYNDYNPVFSCDGKQLFYLTDRQFNAVYSGLGDGTWIYPNNTRLAVIGLTKDSPDLLGAKNDMPEDVKAAEPDKKSDEKEKEKKEKKVVEEGVEKREITVTIETDNMESRLTLLPPKAGNLRGLLAFDGKLVYSRFPLSGDTEGKPALLFYDLDKREEKKITDNIEGVVQTADGKALLVKSSGKYGIIKPDADQKIETPVPVNDLVMQWNPKEEWRQIFNDTWRRYRDFFYDRDMQQVDWEALKIQYGSLIDDARTRWDVTNIQSNLSAELSAGHTYTFGGETENVPVVQTGYLGIDWVLKDNKYAIKRIVKPAQWDEARSPFDQTGINISAGDYILSVNGISLEAGRDPYAAFDGLSGKTVSLLTSKSGLKTDAREVVVKCLTQREEETLRYLEWIESNRKMVEKLSDGNLGYIYMSNTSSAGQQELVRMFYGQLDKKGFVIDERFNGGGALGDRFLELMMRPVIYNLYWRHGRYQTHPDKTNTGPMGMLINGWAGSGGDALPWAFRELNAGPIVGERTLGILVGPATGHELIDGGGITVPGARLYLNNGTWFDEGVGVKPDFPVWDDPNLLLVGRDPQMEKVVEEVMKLLKDNPPMKTPPPEMEDRTAKGLNKKEE